MQPPSRAARRQVGIKLARIKKLLEDTEHDIMEDPGRMHYKCGRCCSRVPKHKAEAWLAAKCVVASSTRASPLGAVSASAAQIGNLKAHDTHDMVYDKTTEVHYCTKCGSFARDTMKDLSKPCDNIMKKAGKQNLARIEKGLMPGGSAYAVQFNAARTASAARASRI